MNDTKLPSGRFLLRLEPVLHARLRDEAAAQRLSLNELCARRLAQPGAAVGGEVLERAASQFGAALRAAVVFGSWARGSARSESDLDVLLVVETTRKLERALYAAWDEEPVLVEGRRVEPHITHLPDDGIRPSGLWCEIGMEGLVLYDRDLATSRYLASVRARIARGEIERRLAHGQPYWAGAA
jgi:hypothetical protein